MKYMIKKLLLGCLFVGILLSGGLTSCQQEMQEPARITLLNN